MVRNGIVEELLRARGIVSEAERAAFLSPSYDATRYDPYQLPEMEQAVSRIIQARESQELVYIYGDYDIDGLSATAILLESLTLFGLRVKTFIPNRFSDGYGLSKAAIKALAEEGATLIITVDCGSLSHNEIAFAHEYTVDVIVTDHHSVGETMPPAVATINPKRKDHHYPFIDLAGCGVAFKLVQALQSRLPGLPAGQEKWLLDLVALGTICDIVSLRDENRSNVYWGLRVLAKTRHQGIKALAQVAGLDPEHLNAKNIGFVIGPHLNAAGRLETARLSLDLITATDSLQAFQVAERLHKLNVARRSEQDRIFKEAAELAATFVDDPVLVVSHPSWSHGIIGIVAAKLLEQFHKPTFVLQELGEEAKGSARSFGDFSAVEGIKNSYDWLTKGGGHKLAAGVTLPTANIASFRRAINDFYQTLGLKDQEKHLEPVADIVVDSLDSLDLGLIEQLDRLEPYGHGNPEPIFRLNRVCITKRSELGSEQQHLKLQVVDASGSRFSTIGFNQSKQITVKTGDIVDIWMHIMENIWQGRRGVEGQLLKVAAATVTQSTNPEQVTCRK